MTVGYYQRLKKAELIIENEFVEVDYCCEQSGSDATSVGFRKNVTEDL